MEITVVKADYLNNTHEEHIQVLLDSYASDPMGVGIPLEEEVRKNVVKELYSGKRSYKFHNLSCKMINEEIKRWRSIPRLSCSFTDEPK